MWGPLPAGDGRSSHHILATDSGVFSLVGIANSALALHIEDINNNNALYVCTGAWSITDAVNGKADFTPSPTDLLASNPLGKAGIYKVYPVVSFNSAPVAMDGQLVQIVSEP